MQLPAAPAAAISLSVALAAPALAAPSLAAPSLAAPSLAATSLAASISTTTISTSTSIAFAAVSTPAAVRRLLGMHDIAGLLPEPADVIVCEGAPSLQPL